MNLIFGDGTMQNRISDEKMEATEVYEFAFVTIVS